MAVPIIGWKIDPRDRAVLLSQFRPKYANTVADHVTFGRGAGLKLPPMSTAHVIGGTDDGAGVEALVVALEGTTDRPAGGTYHITWSLEPGRRPKESNDVIRDHGWEPASGDATVRLTPARWP